jgi:hypothetical protein
MVLKLHPYYMCTYGVSIVLLDRLLQTTNNHYMQTVDAESGVPQNQHMVYQCDYFTINDPPTVENLLEAESQIYHEQGQ